MTASKSSPTATKSSPVATSASKTAAVAAAAAAANLAAETEFMNKQQVVNDENEDPNSNTVKMCSTLAKYLFSNFIITTTRTCPRSGTSSARPVSPFCS